MCTVVLAVVITATLVTTASAATTPQIRHSEEVRFRATVERVIHRSAGASSADHRNLAQALEAEPKEPWVAGRALLAVWRIYRGYDERQLSGLKAPA